jgi:hypothetical protein
LISGICLAGHAKAAQTGQDPMSMQMEVLGHLASLLVVKALIQTDGIVVVNWEIKLSGVIDNKAVLYRIQMARLKGAGLCLRDEWELFHEATQICQQLEITPNLAHVKSHQDANVPYA